MLCQKLFCDVCLFIFHEYHTISQLWILSNHLFLFRVGYKWITQFLALGCYALLLLPGFIQGLNLVIYGIIIMHNNHMFTNFDLKRLASHINGLLEK